MGKTRLNFCIAGRTGSGKSTLARQLLEEHPSRHRLLILVPPKVVDFDYPGTEVHHWKDVRAAVGKKSFQIIWRAPKGPQSAQLAAKLMWAAQDCLLVLDEAQLYLSVPDKRGELRAYCPPAFFELATVGRHRQASYGLIGPRPSFYPTSIKSECNIIAAFVLNLPSDRDAMSDFPGFDSSTPRQIQELDKYEYIRADHGRFMGKQRTLPRKAVRG